MRRVWSAVWFLLGTLIQAAFLLFLLILLGWQGIEH